MDDKKELRGRLIRGFEVMGGLEDLPRLARELGLDGVILAIDRLDEVGRVRLQGILSDEGLSLHEWNCGLRSPAPGDFQRGVA
jgi:FlaA1/EpsC-like NDP-sugar epimerase